jgi:endonuclease/exonuclease/phosphatase family metal-dependent hydrolase
MPFIARRAFIVYVILIITYLPAITYGQFIEDFEQGSKSAYQTGSVELETGSWILNDALLGSSDGDRFNGAQSVRVRDGFIEMEFDYPDGASVLSFFGANSGFSNDTGGSVRILYSTDQGDNWTAFEQTIVLTEGNSLQKYELFLEIDQPVRFRIEKVDGNRISIDDVEIEPFTDLANTPRISLRSEGNVILNNQMMSFPTVQIDQTSTVEFRISNEGEQVLNLESISVTGDESFTILGDVPAQLESRESASLDVQFISSTHGDFSAELTIQSNDPDTPEFSINLNAFSVDEDVLIPINMARDVPLGIRVKVAGIVSVANEFQGPSFIQDEEAGIAVFNQPFSTEVVRGDSVHVQGPVTEFNPIDGPEGEFLVQIASLGSSPVSFDIISSNTAPQPLVTTLSEVNNGGFDSRLVTINNVTFLDNGVFSGDQNVEIRDASGFGQLRIDNSVSELIGGIIPEDPVDVTGVVDKFNGDFQIKPRDSEDLQVDTVEFGGEDVPRDSTFDVVTWNIEWFGSDSRGPVANLQISNVVEVVQSIDAELYAFQEISNRSRFLEMAESLDEYRGFVSFYPQAQQTAYLFKSSIVDSLDSGELREGQDSFDWASGRFPLFFDFNATIGEVTQRITSYNLHAKALGDRDSYNRRTRAAQSLKDFLDTSKPDDNIIVLGDFNDQLNFSTYNQEESPYSIFVEDENYFAVTKSLEDAGFASYLVGQFRSMIDHIVVNNALTEGHLENAQRVENTSYIENFTSTTSDHAPVWSRFRLIQDGGEEPGIPPVEQEEELLVYQNYPNPFTDQTTIRFSLKERSQGSVTVYDITGRTVGIVASDALLEPGLNEFTFNDNGLGSGVYVYIIKLDDGVTETGKMVLIK